MKRLTAMILASSLCGAGSSFADDIAMGKALAFDVKKGNCLACHAMDDGQYPGDIGPALTGMSSRYPNKADLRAVIWDARSQNPSTIMPPYGPHGILSEQEIDQITEYVFSL